MKYLSPTLLSIFGGKPTLAVVDRSSLAWILNFKEKLKNSLIRQGTFGATWKFLVPPLDMFISICMGHMVQQFAFGF